MTTPLPEPDHEISCDNGRIKVRVYFKDALERYGAAEYKRGADKELALTASLSRMTELVGVLTAERDAEIERLKTINVLITEGAALTVQDTVAAQRKVLELALEALKAQPIATRIVWRDGIDIDVPAAHSKLCKEAITAIQEQLK